MREGGGGGRGRVRRIVRSRSVVYPFCKEEKKGVHGGLVWDGYGMVIDWGVCCRVSSIETSIVCTNGSVFMLNYRFWRRHLPSHLRFSSLRSLGI
jgi:hypothetical protein